MRKVLSFIHFNVRDVLRLALQFFSSTLGLRLGQPYFAERKVLEKAKIISETSDFKIGRIIFMSFSAQCEQRPIRTTQYQI